MKVFVIDDDHLSVFLTRHKLVLNGLSEDIESFLSAEEALDCLLNCSEENFPDLVFLDLNMPVLNGWEFLDALTAHESKFKERCSIYILTSSLDLSDTVRTKDYPMVTGLIHKPLQNEDIKAIKATENIAS